MKKNWAIAAFGAVLGVGAVVLARQQNQTSAQADIAEHLTNLDEQDLTPLAMQSIQKMPQFQHLLKPTIN